VTEDVPFNLAGYSSIGGSDAEAIAQFNRGLAARVALYQGDASGALSALSGSFMDFDGDMNTGAYYAFGGATGNDLPNPLFYVPGVDNYMAHPSWVAGAEDGDTRLSKATESGLIELDGLSGTRQVTLYGSNSDPASIMRNEELLLIYAEANMTSNPSEAVRALNVVRNAAGLADYSGGMDGASLTDEVLQQRRYGLFGEGHRWIDLRRFNRLNEIPLDRAGDKVHIQFPRPASEVGG